MIRRLLVLATHPDDEVIAAGGLLARTVAAGGRTGVCFVTQAGSDKNSPEMITSKRAEAEAANRELGTHDLYWAGFAARSLDAVPASNLIGALDEVVKKFNPTTLCIPFVHDLNTDHQATARAALVIARPGRYKGLCEVLYMNECTSSTQFSTQGQVFKPDVYVDVDGAPMARKLAAFSCYSSQLQGEGRPRSQEYLSVCCRADGIAAGMGHAETFQLVWSLWRA
ncbi:MAG: PIG-L deacetylase family protein [Thermodesulfobacteriota bacterium]